MVPANDGERLSFEQLVNPSSLSPKSQNAKPGTAGAAGWTALCFSSRIVLIPLPYCFAMGCNGGRPSFKLYKLSKLCFCPAFEVCTTDAAVTAAGCRIIVLSFSQDPKIPKNTNKLHKWCEEYQKVSKCVPCHAAAAGWTVLTVCRELQQNCALRLKALWGWGRTGAGAHWGSVPIQG